MSTPPLFLITMFGEQLDWAVARPVPGMANEANEASRNTRKDGCNTALKNTFLVQSITKHERFDLLHRGIGKILI